MSDLIPPAVIDIAGDDSSFKATIAADTALLAAWADTTTNTNLGATSDSFQATLATVKSELLDLAKGVTDANLGADAAPFWAGIAELRAMVDAMSPLDIDIDANISLALAKIATLKAAEASAETASLIGAAASGGGGGGGRGNTGGGLGDIIGQITGGALASALYGNTSGSFISRLLSPLTALTTLFSAGFASMGSLAGFGPEHLALTGVGLAGSATGAGLGAGLLGLGSAGVVGVGEGTDMAGIGQATGDIKTYSGLLNNLNQAVAVYGKNSTEAALAQYQMNQWMADLAPTTVAAIAAANNTATAFHAMFDKVTGAAETTGANIISQVMVVAEKFLPTIGRFAAQNMTTIQGALQPLESWLQGPGLSIFNELERKFSSDLPTAMQAFDNGVELLIRTIGLVAPQTGGLIKSIDNLVTKFNGPEWGKWSSEVERLIGMFRTWDSFVKILVEDIADIFSKTAGLAAGAGGIIPTLTKYLTELHKTLNSQSGGDALSSLFTAHKAEVIALIGALVQLGSAFTKVYLLAAPFMVKVATAFIKATSAVIDFTEHLPGGADFLGITLLLGKMGTLSPLLFGAGANATILQRAFGALGSGIKNMLSTLGELASGLLGVGAAGDVAAEGETAATGAAAALNIALGVGVLGAIVALGIGIYELVTHWSTVWGEIKRITGDAVTFVKSHINLVAISLVGLLGPLGVVLAGSLELYAHWRTIWGAIGPVVKDAAADVETLVGALVSGIEAQWDIVSAVTTAAWDIVKGVISATLDLIVGIVKVGIDLLTGNWGAAWNAMKATVEQIWNAISSGVMGAVHSLEAGLSAAWGSIGSAVTTAWGQVQSTLGTAWSAITGIFSGAGTLLLNVGKAIVQGLVNGITSMLGALKNAVGGIVSTVKSVVTLGGLIGSPSPYMTTVGQMMGQGLINGVDGSGPAVRSSLDHLATIVKSVPFGTAGLAGTTGVAGSGGSPVTFSNTYHINVPGTAGSPQQVGTAVKQAIDEANDEMIRRLRAGTLSSA